MKVKSLYVSYVLVLHFIFVISAFPQLQSIKTDNMHLVYYDPSHSYIIPHLIRSYENSLAFHKNLFQFTLSEEVTVFLEDLSDYGRAGVNVIPFNFLMVGLSPFNFAFETNPKRERISALMDHELVHVVTLGMASRTDRFYRSLFQGKVTPNSEDPISIMYGYLTTPRSYAPRWYHEGIAVFMETWMAGGVGRAQGTYDEMVFRTLVRDGGHIYDAVGLESEGTTIDFQVGANSYLYGTRFMSYLALIYGPEKLIQWVSRPDGSKGYYVSQFRHVFGLSLDDAWSEWIEWEWEWQHKNLDRIRTNPVTSYRPILDRPLGAVSRAFYDDKRNEIYAAISYPGQVTYIAGINPENGSVRRIADIEGPSLYLVSSLTYDKASGTIFYTNNNNRWRHLYAVNVDTRNSERLGRSRGPFDIRTGDLAFNPVDRSLWGVRHAGGISSIVRIPYPYDRWNLIRSMPYVEAVFDIDISPDGKYLSAVLFDVGGNHRLILMETEKLLNREFSYRTLYNFEDYTPANFTFSPDGRYLFGSTYYTGVSNIVRYDLETEEFAWLTNAETGYFRPIPFSEDSVITFRFTAEGFLPVMIANERQDRISSIRFLGTEVIMEQPMVKDWHVPIASPSTIDIDELILDRGIYSPAGNMRLASMYPTVRGYKNYVNVGLKFELREPINLNQMDISLSYTPNDRLDLEERFHATLSYRIRRLQLFANYNADDFYDLFGPTKTSRKGYSVGMNYRGSIIFDEPRVMNYTVSGTYYGGLEQLPEFQNIEVRIPDFFIATARLDYEYILRSRGAVDEEKGYRLQTISYFNYAAETLYPRVLTNLNYGIALPIRHSSVWLRGSTGYSFGDREEPLANFYFGGFGNNWVDYQSFRRYREFYSFPGVKLNSIGGTNYGKLLVEWTLPPVRFRRLGFINLYSNWSQVSFFTSGIITNLDHADLQRRVFNIGSQLDFKVVIFSVLESTLSFGYAAAFEQDRSMTDEFMISIKILR
jgi:hypothetical protein